MLKWIHQTIRPAIKISLLYLIWATIWIFTSDQVLNYLIADKETLTTVQSYKGMFFVLITTVLLYYLVYKQMRNENRIQQEKILALEKKKFIFETAPMPLIEDDIESVKEWVKQLPVTNAEELRKYLEERPSEIIKACNLALIRNANAAALNLFEAKNLDELRDHLINNVHQEDSKKLYQDLIVAIYEKKNLIQESITYSTPSQNILQLMINVWIPSTQHNSPMLTTIADITNQKRIQEELDAANRAKSEFMAIMSHEIRTPMHVISGIISLLQEDQEIKSTHEEKLQILKRNSVSMLNLINAVIDVSRLDAGKIKLSSHFFSLNDLVENVRSACIFFCNENAVSFQLVIKEGTPSFFRGDKLRIEQIIINLCTNAIKFTAYGEVKVEIGFNSSHPTPFEIKVSDSGIGMSPKELDKVFTMFTQGDSSPTRKYSGSGIGLSLTQRLVDLMKGQLDIQSVPHQGTTVTVRLDVPQEKQTPIQQEEKNINLELLSGKKILAVDDSHDNLYLLGKFFEKTGAELHTANNGQEAYQRVQQESFDMIFMDIQMPVMDGHSATANIRSWEKSQGKKQTPIIAMTAHAMATDIEESKRRGCNSHLSKPITKKEIFQKVIEATTMISKND